MPDQFDFSTTNTSTVDTAEWFSAHRTTPEEQEAQVWRDTRNNDIEANRKLKTALSHEYDAYRKQIEGLDTTQRMEIADKSPEEIATHLDDLAAQERDRKQLEDDLARMKAEHKEADLVARETEQQSGFRRAFTRATDDVATLDERIAELQRLNELRDDPTDEGWDNLPVEQWRDAREGKLGDWNAEIANLVQEKQAKLQEAALYQGGYHEASRAIQPTSPQQIGQFNGMPLTHGDIQLMVQAERDDQAHNLRAAEARSRYGDWDHVFQSAGNLSIRNDHLAFIKSLPNSADVAYYLATHPNEAMSLGQMPNHDVSRALINISHKASPAQTPQETRRATNAPKPPQPVNGTSSRAFDLNDESTTADDWMRARNADLKRRGKS